MTMFRRIFFFLVVNIAVVMTLSLIMSLLGVQPYLTRYGLNYGDLAIFCLIWGMGGAFISLAMSRVMAKWMMGVKVIEPNTGEPAMRELVTTVHRLAKQAGLTVMPEVGYYESPEVNAFATGPTRSRSLVAVSSGLLTSMDRNQVEGVLGHEVTHIANGDMVTMTLIQGVVNAFAMFLARILAFAISQALRSRDDDRGGGRMMQYMLVWVFEFVFMILGTMVVAAFSRYREFRADEGGAKFAGRDKMISALKGLQRVTARNDEAAAQTSPAIASLKISGRSTGIMRLFMTHPPLEERIARLSEAHILR